MDERGVVSGVMPISHWVCQRKQREPDQSRFFTELGRGVYRGLVYVQSVLSGAPGSQKNLAREMVCISSMLDTRTNLVWPPVQIASQLTLPFIFSRLSRMYESPANLISDRVCGEIGALLEEAVRMPDVKGLYNGTYWRPCTVHLASFHVQDQYGDKRLEYALRAILTCEARALETTIALAMVRRR